MKSRIWVCIALGVVSLMLFAHWARAEEGPKPKKIEIPAEELLHNLQIMRRIDGALTADFIHRFLDGVDPFALPLVPSLPATGKAVPGAGKNEPSFATGTPAYSVSVQIDPDADMETTMSTVQINVGGQLYDHSMIAYMKAIIVQAGEAPVYRTFVRSTKTNEGEWTEKEFPLAGASYDRIIDPVLASNIFTGGVWPKRSYWVTLQDPGLTPTGMVQAPQALALQVSDTGGLGQNPWVDPVTLSPDDVKIVVENTEDMYYLDKPDLVVSPYVGTRGHLYLCYMRLQVSPSNPYNSELYVTRSSNGGVSWSTPVLVHTGRIQAPQISHSANFNRVYLSWVNHDTDRIEFAWSDNQGLTWSPLNTTGAPEIAASGPLKAAENRNIDWTISGFTVPQMRFDWVNNQVVLTWHESEFQVTGTHTGGLNSLSLVDNSAQFVTDGVQVGDYVRNLANDSYAFVTAVAQTQLTLGQIRSWQPAGERNFDPGDPYIVKSKNTDIYYARKTAGGWQPKVRLNVALDGDQFQPSIDFTDQSNRLMVGYLDRSQVGTSGNQLYRPAWILIDAAGARQASGFAHSWFWSDPFDNGTHRPAMAPMSSFIGDYTDMWYWPYLVIPPDQWGPRWHFVFGGRRDQDGTRGDPWAAAIQ